MFEVGQLCIKTAGRDAGNICVVVDTINEHTVLIDGQTRRRPCNIKHLEPINKHISLRKGASHDAVAAAFKKLNYETRTTTPKKTPPRPKKERKHRQKQKESKAATTEEKPPAKKTKKEQPATQKPARTTTKSNTANEKNKTTTKKKSAAKPTTKS